MADDFTDVSLQSALDDWSDAIARQTEQVALLDDAFQAEVNRLLGQSEGQQVDVDGVCVGAEVWVGSGWHRVVSKSTLTDHRGRQLHDLIVVQEGKPSWSYPVVPGEALTVRWSF